MTEQTADGHVTAEQYHDLLFGVRRSVRYHKHRERFLDRISDWSKVATAVAGSATMVSLLSDLGPPWPETAAVATAILAAFEVIFAPGRLARRHHELARGFLGLEQDMLRARTALTEEALLELQTRRLALEADEPPHYRVLNAICHDELVRALGHPEEQFTNLVWIQRVLANFVDLWPHRIRKRAAR